MSNFKFQLNLSMHVGGKCRKGWTDGEPDGRRVMKLKFDLEYIKQSHMKISALYVKARRRKVRKTVLLQYSKFQKGHYTNKNWRELMTLELDLLYS